MISPRPSPLSPSIAQRPATSGFVSSTRFTKSLEDNRRQGDSHERGLATSGAARLRGVSNVADAIQYRVIYVVCFAVFLAAAIIERAHAVDMAWLTTQVGRRQSILEQAGEAAGTCTTYAFMS